MSINSNQIASSQINTTTKGIANEILILDSIILDPAFSIKRISNTIPFFKDEMTNETVIDFSRINIENK